MLHDLVRVVRQVPFFKPGHELLEPLQESSGDRRSSGDDIDVLEVRELCQQRQIRGPKSGRVDRSLADRHDNLTKRLRKLSVEQLGAERVLVDRASRVPSRLVSAEGGRQKSRLLQQARGTAIVVCIALKLAHEYALEVVDGGVAPAKVVVEPEHLDEQACAQTERRFHLRRRHLTCGGIEQHLPLEI